MDNILIIIPTYKPKEKLFIPFIKEVLSTFKNVLIVNDGSGNEYNDVIKKAKKLGCKVIEHDKNYGKGKALKTGFKYAIDNNYYGSVTCDCDGQHLYKDVLRCANSLLKNSNNLILGVRNFQYDYVPRKNKFGNKLTSNMFKIFANSNISDTQTGLRAQSFELMKMFLSVKGERFDFETNALIECKKNNILIKEVVIDTIYIDNNETSHFHPIKDSINVYNVFFKYIGLIFLIILFDVCLFSVLPFNIYINIILGYLIVGTIYYYLHDNIYYRCNYLIYILAFLFISLLLTYLISKLIYINIFNKILLDIIIIIIFSIIKHKLL